MSNTTDRKTDIEIVDLECAKTLGAADTDGGRNRRTAPCDSPRIGGVVVCKRSRERRSPHPRRRRTTVPARRRWRDRRATRGSEHRPDRARCRLSRPSSYRPHGRSAGGRQGRLPAGSRATAPDLRTDRHRRRARNGRLRFGAVRCGCGHLQLSRTLRRAVRRGGTGARSDRNRRSDRRKQ